MVTFYMIGVFFSSAVCSSACLIVTHPLTTQPLGLWEVRFTVENSKVCNGRPVLIYSRSMRHPVFARKWCSRDVFTGVLLVMFRIMEGCQRSWTYD